MKAKIRIEVAYATSQKQLIVECHVEPGTPPREAMRRSGIDRHFAEIDMENCDIGIFGKAIAADYELQDGDRIEIYRPLIADPKEVRRQRAAQGLRTGKGGGKLRSD